MFSSLKIGEDFAVLSADAYKHGPFCKILIGVQYNV